MKHKIGLAIVVLAFCALKAGDLRLPYFWDELGVYSKAALYLYDHTLSLAPSALPVDLSRGHPLLCAYVFALAFRIFGTALWVGHATGLLFACGTIVATFAFGRRFFDDRTGLLAALVLAVQPVFIAQSTLVLPEMMLAGLATFALLAYLRGWMWLYIVLVSAAVLTKESGIALPAVLIACETLRLASTRTTAGSWAKRILANAAPLAVFALFLAVQRMQNGWVFFPYHTHFISLSPRAIWERTAFYVRFALIDQGRFVWLGIFLLALAVLARRHRPAGAQWAWRAAIDAVRNRSVASVLVSYAVAVLALSVLNFHLGRYLLLVVPALSLLVSATVMRLGDLASPRVRQIATVLVVLVPAFFYDSGRFVNDTDMSLRHVVRTQQEATAFLTAQPDVTSGTRIICDFPVNLGLMDTRAGYGSQVISNIGTCTKQFDRAAAYYVYADPGNLEYCGVFADDLQLVREFRSSFSRVLLYRNRNRQK